MKIITLEIACRSGEEESIVEMLENSEACTTGLTCISLKFKDASKEEKEKVIAKLQGILSEDLLDC